MHWFSRSTARLCGLLLLAGSTGLAHAASGDICGVYQNRYEMQLDVLSASRLAVRREGRSNESYAYQRNGNSLDAVDLDSGSKQVWQLSPDEKTLSDPDVASFDYTLVERHACQPDTPIAAKTAAGQRCWKDLRSCANDKYSAELPQLEAWCQDGVPFACNRLIDKYAEQAEAQARAKAREAKTLAATPPACRKGTPSFDEAACKKLVKQIDDEMDAGPLGRIANGEKPPVCTEGNPAFDKAQCSALMARMIREQTSKIMAMAVAQSVSTMYADPTSLSTQQLDKLPVMCTRTQSARTCTSVAERLWDGGRYQQAQHTLQSACAAPISDQASCDIAQGMGKLDAATLSAPASEGLPCGEYVAQTGLMDQLVFGDEGVVEGPMGAKMQARYEDGKIRIRHDKGGDFVFRHLADGRLLAVDRWNRFAVYTPQNGTTPHCSAPVVHR